MRLSRPAIAFGSEWSILKPIKLPLLGGFIALTLAQPVLAAKPVNNKSGGSQIASVEETMVSLESERYLFRDLSGDNSCLGEDDELRWKAVGSLAPGESFSFTPQYTACKYHPAAISAVLSWQGGELELSSHTPDQDRASDDPEQKGKYIVAPSLNNRAQLCMFPFYRSGGLDYTITVTNVGATTVSDIALDARSGNDWPVYYYARCINADADGDGWNDSLEHTMANLLYPKGYIDGVYQMNILWGSNYLRADVATLGKDDEIDVSPADLNDDGIIDNLDIEILRARLGEGNGIPLEAISPNPGDIEYMGSNAFTWRRYDLDGDGYVGLEDLDIISTLEGEILPMVEDIIAPTARVRSPSEGEVIAKGSRYLIRGHVWDNAAITQVDYLVDGKTVCSVTDPVPSLGYVSPFYFCSWSVPKRQGQYRLSIRVTDEVGLVTTSKEVTVWAQ
ncbi:Ig-like domain-containing protein [Zobellella denitrificans]